MGRTLKIWNGRAYCCYKHGDPEWEGISNNGSATIFAAAYSRADLRRMIEQYSGVDPGDTEIKVYWCEGSWGMRIEGITPERGLWLKTDCTDKPPVRLV